MSGKKRERVVLFANTAGAPLLRRVCGLLGKQPGKARVARFNDGEIDVEIRENLRGAHVFIVAPTPPPAENFLEAALLCAAARNLGPRRITLLIPYLGYNRQDQAHVAGSPHSARTFIKLLARAGADDVVLVDLHASSTLKHFGKMSVAHLSAAPLAARYLRRMLRGSVAVASPDRGGTARAEAFARLLGEKEVITFHKTRPRPGAAKVTKLRDAGRVRDKTVLFIDDMIDTGGTLVAAARAARAAGAKKIYAFATHGIFSKNALARLHNSPLNAVVVTDSLPQVRGSLAPRVVSVAPLLAEIVRKRGKSS